MIAIRYIVNKEVNPEVNIPEYDRHFSKKFLSSIILF